MTGSRKAARRLFKRLSQLLARNRIRKILRSTVRRMSIEPMEERRVLATFVVNSTLDTIAVDGQLTLREALTAANTNATSGDAGAGSAGLDTIQFSIGVGAATIAPSSALPLIVEAIAIDGTTQPGYAGSPLIQLDGSGAGPVANGLRLGLGSSSSVINGLAVNRFGAEGISIGSSTNTISNNFIGTDPTGTFDLGNTGNGIYVSPGSNSNTIKNNLGPV